MADILIADDDPANRSLMQFVLEAQGGHHVSVADSAAGALQALERDEPDLVVLDVVMPGMSGLDLCRALRRHRALPILMVSGLGAPPERVAGLRSGADDYLPKPFDPAELLERVNALLRRARRVQFGPTGTVLRAGDLRLQPVDRRLWVGERGPIDLTPTECRLLHTMLLQPETVWARAALLERLWDTPAARTAGVASVESCISRLRAKLEPAPHHPVYLVTVRGRGYRLRSHGPRSS